MAGPTYILREGQNTVLDSTAANATEHSEVFGHSTTSGGELIEFL